MALERVAGYSREEIPEVVSDALRRQLAAGVTTVCDLGDQRFNVVDRRDAQRQVDDGCGLPAAHATEEQLAALAASGIPMGPPPWVAQLPT